MGKFQGTFQRYEKKYLLNEKTYRLLRRRLQDKVSVDNYGKTTICNIYFDTPNYQLVRTSLEKPVYKEKLRLRSYGIPEEGDMVFAELKKKYKGVVYKRREKLELIEAEHYLYDKRQVSAPSQITKEIDWFFRFYQGLEPSMYISYDRVAMYGLEDSNMRITFDSNILWRKEELWLEAGSWGNSLIPYNWRLMEIKILGAMPVWLSSTLDELRIYPVSFSKYGKAYQELITEDKKDDKEKEEKMERREETEKIIDIGDRKYA